MSELTGAGGRKGSGGSRIANDAKITAKNATAEDKRFMEEHQGELSRRGPPARGRPLGWRDVGRDFKLLLAKAGARRSGSTTCGTPTPRCNARPGFTRR